MLRHSHKACTWVGTILQGSPIKYAPQRVRCVEGTHATYTCLTRQERDQPDERKAKLLHQDAEQDSD